MNITPKAKRQISLAATVLGIFTITYTILVLVGFAPKQFQSEDTVVVGDGKSIFEVVGNSSQNATLDKNLIPQKIEIPKIGVSSNIQVPNGIDVGTLDAALARGAVYYPGSGTLQAGNMFLFGHSTNWKVVNNQAYKTFNGLDKLTQGDEIEITSGDKEYIYKVRSVTRASQDDVKVEFNKGDRMLTISTCDTFGKKQDRWVVEAEYYKTI